MRILELVFQGVAGSPGLTRVQLGTGTSLVRPGPENLPVGRLVAYALYDESVEPPAELRAPQAQASRVALTLQDFSGKVYRILRDLSNGAVQLARYEAQAKTFEMVSSRAAEAGQYLRSQARVAPEDLFQDLLWLESSHLPSRWRPGTEPGQGAAKKRAMPVMGGAAAAAHYQAKAAAGGQSHSAAPQGLSRPSALADADSSGSVGGGGPDPYASLPLEARREKLAEFERIRAAIEEVDELQFSLDGKQRAVFEMDQKLQKLTVAEKEVSGLEEALAGHGGLDALDEEMTRKIKEYDFLASRLEKTLERIEDERQKMEERLAYQVTPPHMNRMFQAGAGATLLFTLVGIVFEPARWVLFLNLASLGVVTFALLEWIGEIEDHHGVGGKRSALDERAEQARRQFEVETTSVRRLMSQMGVESVGAINERLAARQKAVEAHQAAKARLEEMRSSPELASLGAQRGSIEKEIEEIEEKLLQAGTAGVSPVDLMRDIEALRASIERTESGVEDSVSDGNEASPDPLLVADGSASPAEMTVSAPSGPVMPDPGPILISRLGDALLCSVSEAGERLAPRVGQFAGALTSGRWTAVGFHGKGGTMVMSAPSGSSAGWEEIQALDRDLVFLAVRLAFAEAVVRAGAQPLLFERALDLAPFEPVRPVLAQIVRHLGTLTQTLHLSADPFWAGHVDAEVLLASEG